LGLFRYKPSEAGTLKLVALAGRRFLQSRAGYAIRVVQRLQDSSGRAFLALIDQALFSSSSLVINALLARVLSPEDYGAFAVAFLIYLFCAGFHNAMLLEPMSVLGSSSYADRLHCYIRAQLRFHVHITTGLGLLLACAAGVLFLFPADKSLSRVLMAVAITLPILLLFWVARRFHYVEQNPAAAALSSGLYTGTAVGCVVALHAFGHLTSVTAFAALAAAAMVGSVRFLVGVRRETAQYAAIATYEVVRTNWNYGRWLLTSALLYPVSVQIQVFVAAGSLGLGAAGVLRAVQLPSIAMTQAIAAIGTLELPALSFAFGSGDLPLVRRRATQVTGTLVLLALAYEAVLILANHRIERLLYDGKFSDNAWLMASFGIAPVFSAYLTGRGTALRAIRKPQFDLAMNLITAPFGLASAFAFVHWWGISGAVASNLATAALSAMVLAYFYRNALQISSLAVVASGHGSPILAERS